MYKKNKITVEEVNSILDDIRPHIHNDGGDIEVVDVNSENEVVVKWLGACATCDKRELTFKFGIKDYLMEKLPDIKNIIQV